ncbi:uncharacterized protein LOC122275700 isoform X12 [Carya illinoinensis]|uniref:uncharacterized protein LOC122275700 isoform X12 n=1 Tax=Carya illinoinensis TaxID=32201 RepID=UPI001C7203F6|nr:uncharacterized protein LOC122275700 isoform X12 [Carya illinoinensis]
MFDISLSYFLLHFYPFFPILEYLVPITCLLHPPPNDFISIFDHVPKLSPPPHFPPMEAMVELVSSPYYAVRFVLWAVGFFHRFLSIRGRYLLFETLGYLPSPQVGGKRTVLHSSGVKSDRPQIRELVPEHRGFTHIHPYQVIEIECFSAQQFLKQNPTANKGASILLINIFTCHPFLVSYRKGLTTFQSTIN